VQTKEVTVGGLYLSGAEPLVSFAAGDATELTLEVRWRSGRRSVIEQVRPNRLYEIHEPGDTVQQTAGLMAGAPAPAGSPTASRPHFADVSGMLDHRHVERLFDDYARQSLLPYRLSQLGPGVAFYDVDRDGDEDLLIASGRGGQLAYYENAAGRLVRVPLALPSAPFDQTTVLGMPDGTGGTALLVGQMNYEAQTPAEAREAASVLRVTLGPGPPQVSEAVPGLMSSTGPLALADYDGDGDLDLFVGGRVLPANYPLAASSRLFLNEGGRFRLDAANAPRLAALGLVSAALFSDLDGDGDPDLALALEWGPLTLLRNDQGRFTDATAAWGLSALTSRWNGLTAGDLDGDGRLDLVATSWGRNIPYPVSPARPLVLYYADFDKNGTLDLIRAQQDPRLGALAPLEDLLRLTRAIPLLRRRVRSFAEYADATLAQLLGPQLTEARRLEATTFDHLVLLNRGGRVEPVPLPVEAQFAPAFYVGIADFDGDGNEDVFLTQNFFPTHLDAPRYDAGRSLWLRGDGTGRLTAVPGAVSGLTVYGDQRGGAFADYDADGRLDLVVTQNGAATKLYRNLGATPGLRVRLLGPPANPDAIGAQLRLRYPDGRWGPLRELHAGSGYWAHNGAVQVLGQAGTPSTLWVRWPDGSTTETTMPPKTPTVTIHHPDKTGKGR
jgi:hypothetical protein